MVVQQADLLPAKSLFHLTCFLKLRAAAYQVRFGRAMVRTLARGSRAEEAMATPNDPAMQPKRSKKVRLAVYLTQRVRYRVSDLIDILDYKDSRHSS